MTKKTAWSLLTLIVLVGAFLTSTRHASSSSANQQAAIMRNHRVTSNLLLPLTTVFDVDRTDDTAGATACTAAANDCSLRGAIEFANSNAGTTINVPAGNYNLTNSAPEAFYGDNSTGDLDISGNNTSIVGAGASTTIITQTSSNDRVIEVNPNLDAGFVTSAIWMLPSVPFLNPTGTDRPDASSR